MCSPLYLHHVAHHVAHNPLYPKTMIPLQEFEFHFDEGTLKRGLDLIKKGLVRELTETSEGEREFYVQDGETFTVQLTLKGATATTEHACTCSMGRTASCRHVAACILFLQKDVLGLATEVAKPKRGRPKAENKKMTVGKQIEDIFSKVTHNDLVDFLKELIKNDPRVKNDFLLHFSDYNKGVSYDVYSKSIKDSIKSFLNNNWSVTPSLFKKT